MKSGNSTLMDITKLIRLYLFSIYLKGRPIYIEITGDFDLSSLFKVTSEDRMQKYYVKEYERLMKYRFPACTYAYGKLPIEQGMTILDLKGIGISLLTPKVKNLEE